MPVSNFEKYWQPLLTEFERKWTDIDRHEVYKNAISLFKDQIEHMSSDVILGYIDYILSQNLSSYYDQKEALEDFKKYLKSQSSIILEQNIKENKGESPKKINMERNKVFIVHGHNNGIKIDVARTLEKLGLDAIILHEQADGGKTIIEKFEKNVIDVGFAVILLTADDEGKAKREKDYKDRARQNVVFEMGYFMGKLGRDRVLLLLDKGVEKPGDLDGIVYTLIEEHDAWKYKLVKEMKAVGYPVSADSL